MRKAAAKHSELSLGSGEGESVGTGMRELADPQWELGDKNRTEWCQTHHRGKIQQWVGASSEVTGTMMSS